MTLLLCFVALEFYSLEQSLVGTMGQQNLTSDCAMLLLQRVVILNPLFYSFSGQKRHLLTDYVTNFENWWE